MSEALRIDPDASVITATGPRGEQLVFCDRDGATIFAINGEKFLELRSDGISVRGEEIEDPHGVYHALHYWLATILPINRPRPAQPSPSHPPAQPRAAVLHG